MLHHHHHHSFHFIIIIIISSFHHFTMNEASQPVGDQPEGRRSTATRLVPTQLVPPFLSNRSSRAPPATPIARERRFERNGGTSWVGTSRVAVDLLPSGWSPTGWLASFTSLSTSYSAGLKSNIQKKQQITPKFFFLFFIGATNFFT